MELAEFCFTWTSSIRRTAFLLAPVRYIAGDGAGFTNRVQSEVDPPRRPSDPEQ